MSKATKIEGKPVKVKGAGKKKDAGEQIAAVSNKEEAVESKIKEPLKNSADSKPIKNKIAKSTELKIDAEKVADKNEPVAKIQTPRIEVAKKSAKKTAVVAKKAPSKKNDKAAPVADKNGVAKENKEAIAAHKVIFLVRFHTTMGQSLFITANHPLFGNADIDKALPMQYLSDELWSATLEINTSAIPAEGIVYNYLLKNEDGSVSYDWGSDKILTATSLRSEETLIIDSWNFAGYFENAFYSEPFKNVLLKQHYTAAESSSAKTFTHTFKVKSPLLTKGQTLFLLGNAEEMGGWDESKLLIMSRKATEDFFTVNVNLAKTSFPVYYKYGVYDIASQKVVRYEDGNNRMLFDTAVKTKKTIVNDGFVVLPSTGFKGAGVAIPVFSLRSAFSGGCGEFADLKLMVGWAKQTGLKLIQILPINDTTATYTYMDSYPYAAISAFALHPMYINLWQAAEESNKHVVEAVAADFHKLNKLDTVDYDAVNILKWQVLKQLYPLQKDALFASPAYKAYFDTNKHWLIPYSIFCYFRDKYNTADFTIWPTNKTYIEAEAEQLLASDSSVFDHIAIHFFVQYYLHLQLKDATNYAHENGVVVKGDIPIGIYRYGADAWQQPELYHMNFQAGAPPDDFAVTGQNWGFPTYNWEQMRKNGFAWWKQRFEQMSYYFDAFRIDHILGFFRIWSIPFDSVEGIMGHFEPAIAVHVNEFRERNIWFDYYRYCMPYITEQLLNEKFGDQIGLVLDNFLNYDGFNRFQFKPEFSTQRLIENYFSWQEDNQHNQWLKKELLSLTSNVILFEVEGSQGKEFHFRFGMEGTISFQHLDGGTQQQLKELYIDYFFRRQDNFWSYQAMQKLPALKRATNMLVCGEDLGLVPGCVPEVMRQMGILSLEIQRMPKDPKHTFFHPADAPYMSVVTPSTHDMSTIRGWWEEDRVKTQQFYNNDLGQWGDAPYFCDAWVNKAIVVQHLYSPAMWSIFQLQDILGSDVKIRRPNPHEERINVPANPKHYWNYRMHLTLEDLNKAGEFNTELNKLVKLSGRA